MSKKFNFIILALVFCILFTSAKTSLVFASEPTVEEKIYCDATLDDEFSADNVLVVLTKEASISLKNYTTQDFSNIDCYKVKDLTSATTAKVQESLVKGEQAKEYNRILEIRLNNSTKQKVLDTIDTLILMDEVKYAGPDYLAIQPAAISDPTSSVDTNDTYASQQWGLVESNVPQCWNFTTGSPEVLVGVVDSGIACDVNDTTNTNVKHPDLVDVVDGELSRDFTQGLDDPVVGESLKDSDGHGTHIAGIISAVGNNNQGVAGVCWNVKLVSLKVYQSSMPGSDEISGAISNIVKAINYAEAQGISILNLSFSHDNATEMYLVEAALSVYSGLAVCAAGNHSTNKFGYPAAFNLENIISVGALENNNGSIERWVGVVHQSGYCEGSNYGDWVAIFAPGCDIYSTAKTGEYEYKTGTSMAAPFVVGVAAMLKSINPNLTTEQIKNAIINSAPNYSYSGKDYYNNDVMVNYSSKRLNAFAALKYIMNNYNDSLTLSYTDKTYSKAIDSSKTIYNEKTAMVKLDVKVQGTYSFSLSSTDALCVKLYNNVLGEIAINKTVTNNGNNVSFSTTLSQGVYYLETQYSEVNKQGTITINIAVPPHTHSYTNRYLPYNSIKHKAICVCNEYIYVPHVLLQPNPNKCIDCGYELQDNGFGNIIHSVMKTHKTENGSYILYNGVIVLNELDLEAYYNGTLVFMPYNAESV